MVAIPVLVVPMTMNFASALTFYWASSNLISLLQARMLKTISKHFAHPLDVL